MSQEYNGTIPDLRTDPRRSAANDALSTGRTIRYSLAVFGAFLLYFFVSSNLLPIGAGPDYAASNDVVQFIYTHDRLAVLPGDEDKLYYSAYGSTRTLRPPLAYVVSAEVAKLVDSWVANRYVAFRKGSSLLGAAAVAVVFYTASMYFNSYVAGFMAALLFGLLPQFAFIASYTNDDSGAIFSATLLLSSLVRILRKGVTWTNLIFLGVAGGLVIISKETAWLLAPTVLAFLLFFVRAPWKRLLKFASAGLVVLILSGGWWILFNVYHYGLDDPFALKVERELAARHTRFDPDKEFGYQARGVGYTDLLAGNHDNFWLQTIASTIGNLDWLRIRVGPLQYGLYIVLFAAGMFYVLVRLCGAFYRKLKSSDCEIEKDVIFEGLLAFAIVFQFYMYVWANMHNDVQLQGKYLLPVFLAVVLLGMSGFRSAVAVVAPVLTSSRPRDVVISGAAVRKGSIIALAAIIVGIHIDAILNYVVPFYRPHVYHIRLHRGFQNIAIPASSVARMNDISGFSVTDAGFRMVSEGADPWFVVDISGRSLCRLLKGHNILKARINSQVDGTFKVYVDRGRGFIEADSTGVRYAPGENEILLVFDVPRCSALRLDPATGPTPLEVDNMSLGKIVIEE